MKLPYYTYGSFAICYEPNSERPGSAWMAYMNARVAGLFLLVLLEYPNGKGVVRAKSRGLDIGLHWSGVGAVPLISPRQDETSEPLLYAGWMAGHYQCKDAMRGRNDDRVTSGIRARGRDDLRHQPKKRGTSKDVLESLDQRVAGVETSMAELKNQVEGLEGLDSNFMSMRDDFRVALNTLSGELMFFEGLQADMALCKRSLVSGGGNTNHGLKIDVPKPSPFMGKQEARAVDDFLWEIEQYLKCVNVVDDASKIKMATRYLKDTAAL
ncbi:hypothetical protein Tco_0845413 [Tanacetum coccineum]